MNKIRIVSSATAGGNGIAAFSAAALSVGENVHRPARLFVAGSYPDKGCTVTEDDLDLIVTRFNREEGTIPIKAEHVDSPLDPLGEVVALYRQGKELFGMLAFSAGVNAHIDARGVQDLSVALIREAEADGGGYRLTETSLVFKGRVPGAGFLSAEQVSSKLSEFRAAGKLTPAMEPFVNRLLSAPQFVEFSESSSGSFAQMACCDVAADTIALLTALPIVQPRTPVAAAPFWPSNRAAISAETQAMAKRLGLAPDRLHGELNRHSDRASGNPERKGAAA